MAAHGPEGEKYGLWLLEVANPGWDQVLAGQFAMIRPLTWGLDPIWARPFSISRVTREKVGFFFQVVGKGTAKLAGLRPGDRLTMWGPLGQGFAVEKDKPTLMVAGGVGLAPFVQYVGAHPDPSQLKLLFGHRPPISCYPHAQLAQQVQAWSFQDQTPEDIPRFVQLVKTRMAECASGLVLACGPTPLLKVVQDTALELGVRAQVSLENRMACGVGACLGCVAKNQHGVFQQTCTEGPVFWADSVVL